MRLFVCMLNPLVQENVTLYCPLKMTTFIMQSVAFILRHPSSYNAQFSLTLNDLTLLEAIFIAFLHQ